MVAGGSWWAPTVKRSMCIGTYTVARAPIVLWQLALVDIYFVIQKSNYSKEMVKNSGHFFDIEQYISLLRA
jgi:hypothetical protein